MAHEMLPMQPGECKKRDQSMGTYVALSIRKHHIDIQIEYMERYNKELEAKFKKDLNDTEEYYSKQIEDAKNDPEDAETFAEFCFEDKEAIYEFIRTFRHSSIVNLFSFLEVSLNKLCLIVRKAKAINLSPDDLIHKGVIKSQVYLEKVCSIDFPSGCNDWQQIIKLNRVRNQIVHEQGYIKDKTKNPGKKLFNIVKQTDGLSIERDSLIVIEENYFFEVLMNIKTLLDTVYKKMLNSLKDVKD